MRRLLSFGDLAAVACGRFFDAAQQLVNDAVAALDRVRAVGRIFEIECKERELIRELAHVRVITLRLVEDQVSHPVERLQVGLDTRGLVGLFALVRPDMQLYATLAPHLGHKRLKDLLKNGSSQLVVLHVAIHGGLTLYAIKELHIPVDKLRVERLVEACADDV